MRSWFSRENNRATLRSLTAIFLVTGIGAAYLLISMWLVINLPLLHFVWILATLFVAFYAASALTNYTAAVAFINLAALGIPLWDRHVPAETNVEDTLRVCLAVSIAVVITWSVEVAFARVRPEDDFMLSISDRLSTVAELFTRHAECRAIRSRLGSASRPARNAGNIIIAAHLAPLRLFTTALRRDGRCRSHGRQAR